jgi:hypothetical protein
MLSLLAKESQLLYTLLAAIGAAFAIPEVWMRVALAAAALVLGLLVRQTVSSPQTVANAVHDAALLTAETLSEQTAGIVGEVTDTARDVVDAATNVVLEGVGGLVPKLAGGKQ